MPKRTPNQTLVEHHRAVLKRVGAWAGVRYLRNRGFTFEYTYFVQFGRFPTK